jgi:hypothetical protein
MKDITTIKLHRETKERLSRLKENKRETYEEIIRKILYILNKIRKDPTSSNRLLLKIDNNIRRKEKYTKEKDSKNKLKEIKE